MTNQLTAAQQDTLRAIQVYLKAHAADGREVAITEIFPARDNIDNARRRTARRMADNRILALFGIDMRDGMLAKAGGNAR